MSAPDARAQFERQMGDCLFLKQLFESLPDVYLFVKNRRGEFVMGNQMLAHKFGFLSEDEIIGKTDYDLSPKELADNFAKDDNRIIETGQPIVNKVELVQNEDGSINWHVTTKVPVRGADGSIIGVAGATRDLRKASASFQPYEQMERVVEYIRANYRGRIEPKDLAAVAHLSVSQLERKFRRMFHASPTQYVTRVRINAACHELAHSNKKIAVVAGELGFYDHSYFTKRFREFMGVSPAEYRRRHGITD